MAALRGVMNYGHHAGSVSRLAHDSLSSKLSTWHTEVYTNIDKYGRVVVDVSRNGNALKSIRIDKPECSVEEMEKDLKQRANRR